MLIEKRFNEDVYEEYLNDHLWDYAIQHYDDGLFFILHDGHPCHKSNFIKKWFEKIAGTAYENIVLPHPAIR